MQKQKIYIVISVVSGLLVIILINLWIMQQKQALDAQNKKERREWQANQTSVLVAKQDIPKGVEIDQGMLDAKVVSNNSVQPQAVTSLDRIAGMTTTETIARNEQITLSKLSFDKTSGGALSEVTPVGKRAITIAVDNISALAGMIKAGDCVDIIAKLPFPMQGPDGKMTAQLVSVPAFQRVTVLAVGTDTKTTVAKLKNRSKEESKGVPLITVALSPQEVNILSFIQENGKISLVMRSPGDAAIEQPVQPVGWDKVLDYIAPQMKPVKREEPKPVSYIEVYRGLNKEKIPVFNK